MKIDDVIYSYLPKQSMSLAECDAFIHSADEVGQIFMLGAGYDHVPSEELYDICELNPVEISPGQHAPRGAGTASNLCSHIRWWRYAVAMNRCVAILEHDVRIMRNFRGIDVPENTILTLGPRVPNESIYVAPNDPYTNVTITRNAGSHAYAITPGTASSLLETIAKDGVFDSIDQMLFMNQKPVTIQKLNPDIVMAAVDPSPCVAVYENGAGRRKPSSIGRTTDNQQPDYNFDLMDGFLKGLKQDCYREDMMGTLL